MGRERWLIDDDGRIVPNPYLRPNSQRKEADEAKAQFAHPHGDHLSLLNLYHAYRGS